MIVGLLVALLAVGIRAWRFVSGSYAMKPLQPRNLAQIIVGMQRTLMDNLTEQLASLRRDMGAFEAKMA